MIPEIPVKFDLPLARRLAEFSRRAYQDETVREGARPPLLFDPYTDAHVLIEDIGDAIVLAFRGTKDVRDWLTGVEFLRHGSRVRSPHRGKNQMWNSENRKSKIKVHEGFLKAIDSLLPKIVDWLDGPEMGSAPKPLLITGHSLGGALAFLAQADMDSLPASWLKNMVIFTIAIIAVASFASSAFITILQYVLEKRRDAKSSTESQPREILPQPLGVEKMSKRYNHDAHEQRFKTLEITTDRHGNEIEKLKDTLRIDLPLMERRLDKANEERVGNVHDRVNEIWGEVKELRGEIKRP